MPPFACESLMAFLIHSVNVEHVTYSKQMPEPNLTQNLKSLMHQHVCMVVYHAQTQ